MAHEQIPLTGGKQSFYVVLTKDMKKGDRIKLKAWSYTKGRIGRKGRKGKRVRILSGPLESVTDEKSAKAD